MKSSLQQIVDQVNNDIHTYYKSGGDDPLVANNFVLDAIKKYPVFAQALTDETIIAGVIKGTNKLCVAIKR